MKIALITSMKYGLAKFIFRNVQALINKGNDVRLFTLYNKPGLYNPLPEWDLIPVNLLRLGWRQLIVFCKKPDKYLRLLLQSIQDRTFVNFLLAVYFTEKMKDRDLIFVQFGDHKFFVGYYCKKLLGIPLVVIIHAYELYKNPNPNFFKKALQYCDHIITISDYNKELLVNKYGADNTNIEVVRLTLDLEAYKQTKKINILVVGYFAEKKGHEILFHAVKKMARSDIEIWVVGDITPMVTAVDCRKLVQDLGIESQIAFFGPQRDNALRALYRESDVFCLPSRKDRDGDCEGFPNVIAEAMAFGKPVVTTRHVGIPEAIDAILVDENNVAQLAAALNQVCDSVELRTQLGAQNRRRAEQMFSSSNHDRLVQILEDNALKQ